MKSCLVKWEKTLYEDDLQIIKSKKPINVKLQSMANVGIHAAEIVHNLKNPLVVAIHNTKKLRTIENNEDLKLSIDRVDDALKRVLDIVSNTLSATREISFEETPTNVRSSILEVINTIELNKDKEIKKYLEIDIEEGCCINISSVHLQQIISNLLNNAIEELSQSENRAISIIGKPIGKIFALSIHDNGKGIPKENIEKIFKAGFSTKNPGEEIFDPGTGLGLSFVKRMVELYKGKVYVESSKKGTTFELSFPLVTNS